MTAPEERKDLISLCDEASSGGARRSEIGEVAGIHPRTINRWRCTEEDLRPSAEKRTPSNALSRKEREAIIEICNQEPYASQPPAQIVTDLADKGVYLGSESTLYRSLRACKQLTHRGRAHPPEKRHQPTSYEADGPNQVWTWDITWLPTHVRGIYLYLYLVLDIFSRKIVGWEVHEYESGDLAAALVEQAILRERCPRGSPLVLHSDNGSPMKSQILQLKLKELGIESSYSRPRVSNDNPYSEAIFRTLKYHWDFPFQQGFQTLDEARMWILSLVRWYNTIHRHSGIKYVTPEQKHRQEDVEILRKRALLYEQARKNNPARWSGNTRDWSPVATVWLNPDKDQIDSGKILNVA